MIKYTYHYTFSSGSVDISVYADDLKSAKRAAWIVCEQMARRLNDEIDSEGSSLLTRTDIVRGAV